MICDDMIDKDDEGPSCRPCSCKEVFSVATAFGSFWRILAATVLAL